MIARSVFCSRHSRNVKNAVWTIGECEWTLRKSTANILKLFPTSISIEKTEHKLCFVHMYAGAEDRNEQLSME